MGPAPPATATLQAVAETIVSGEMNVSEGATTPLPEGFKTIKMSGEGVGSNRESKRCGIGRKVCWMKLSGPKFFQ
jgi:hypothetical protein